MEGKLNNHLRLDSGIFYTKGKMLNKNRPLPSIPPVLRQYQTYLQIWQT